MRILLLLFICSVSFAANPYVYRVDTSSTNIASTFPAGPQLAGPPNSIAVVQVSNTTGVEIEVNCTSVTKPSSLASTSFFVQPYQAWETPDAKLITVPFGKVCWFRGISTVSSGIFEAVAWGY